MLGKFNKYIRENALFTQNDMVLVAVSGGLDSCVLIRLLLEGGYRFGIAHMNFGLRGIESDEDQEFVEQLAQSSKCPFHTITVNLMDPGYEGSIQMRARQARYQWFEDLLKDHPYTRLLTAHHADDHLETLLLQLGRGGKLDAMGGIPQQHQHLVRPLLFATRQELQQYAKAQSLKWREDSTNKEDKYQRNYIRHHVVPEIKEIFPSINSSIQFQYKRNQQLISFLKEQLQKECATFFESKNGQLSISKKLLMHPQGELLLHCIIEPYGFSMSRASEIFASITTGAYWQSLSYQCWNDRQHWILRPNQTSFEQEYWIEEGMSELEFGPHFHLRCSFTTKEDFAVSENIAWLNADVLKFPLLLRTAREGDKIQPLGMDGSKKISDLLIDLKVSRADKNQVWVIESDSEVAWVLGYRISHRFRLLSETQKVYKIIFNS